MSCQRLPAAELVVAVTSGTALPMAGDAVPSTLRERPRIGPSI